MPLPGVRGSPESFLDGLRWRLIFPGMSEHVGQPSSCMSHSSFLLPGSHFEAEFSILANQFMKDQVWKREQNRRTSDTVSGSQSGPCQMGRKIFCRIVKATSERRWWEFNQDLQGEIV